MPIKKYFFVFLFSFALIAVLSLASAPAKVGAGMDATVANDVGGYAWSENIGWVSFNCQDNNSCNTSKYGVDMNTTTGVLTGYAWSDNIGWISFNDNGCPSGFSGNCAPTVTGGVVSGWARAVAAIGRSDGWDGWISLKKQSSDDYNYGVTYNTTTQQFSGFAWGSDVVGWLSFNKTDTGSGVNYFVYGPGGQGEAPGVPGNLDTEDAWCNATQSAVINLSYTQPSGTLPITYHIYRSTSNSDDSFTEVGQTTGTTYVNSGLDLNTNYWYKVKASNAFGSSALSNSKGPTKTPSDCDDSTEPVVIKSFTGTPAEGVSGYRCTLAWELESYSASTTCTLTGPGISGQFNPNTPVPPNTSLTGSQLSNPITTDSSFTFTCSDGPQSDTVFRHAICRPTSDFTETSGE